MNVVVFWEEGFPFLDTRPLTLETLRAAFTSEDTVRFVTASDLPAALETRPDLFVNPHGSAFPKPAWSAFTAYLRRGGNWVNLGGAPLIRPVRWESAWRVEPPQTAYLKALRLNHTFPVDLPPGTALRCPPVDVGLEAYFHRFKPTRAHALQPRFAERRDDPREVGAPGGREAILRPLILAEKDGRAIAAPVVALDRLVGDFAGGRWVLVNCETPRPLPAPMIGHLCRYAVRPRATLDVRPSFACYYPGEMAALNVHAQASFEGDLKINLRVFSRDTQKEVYAHIFRARSGAGPAIVQTSPFPAPDPGLYLVRSIVEAEGHSKPIAYAETGFWVYDRDLMTAGKPLATDDLFLRDGRPYPVTGTTYMAGDANRRFLFEPNPAVWDADFAAMKAAGVNMVRTGFWTGWRRAMVEHGAMDEGVLRAFAAWLLTARRHDIPVIFTFFAFLPEAWGGENPYLDPRATAAQAAFVAAFARRFACVNDLLWDLINEPSFCSPKHVWRCRPSCDRFERSAWAEWLRAQGASDDEWRERWGLTPDDPLDLPPPEDFEDRHVFQGTHPFRARDYRRFAQEKFAEWAARMVAVIRENGSPHQLVTVGQDEGGAGERPGPHFHGPAVDFTSNHSWWRNGDLLWDTVITKTPDRPHLIEETGVMFGEDPDGTPRRTPEEARNLLERKMALAFAAGGAGFIQWQWNTNVLMDSDIEAGIGLLRADGTEKPEMEAFRGVARFFAENEHRMAGRRPEQAAVVIPYSSLFGVRDTATAATQRAVRVLEYHLGIPCRAVSEYRAEEIGDARLIVLPAPRCLTEACWQALLAKVHAGATMLVTGFVEADEYGRRVPRLAPFGLETRPAPVALSECVMEAKRKTGDERFFLFGTFGGNKQEKIERAVAKDRPLEDCVVISHGEGEIYYCPLPLELADQEEETELLYRAVGWRIGLYPENHTFRWRPPLLERRVEYGENTLIILVNETSTAFDSENHYRCGELGLSVPAGRIALAFVDRASGEVVAKYEVGAD